MSPACPYSGTAALQRSGSLMDHLYTAACEVTWCGIFPHRHIYIEAGSLPLGKPNLRTPAHWDISRH